jgi:hypothetical protein
MAGAALFVFAKCTLHDTDDKWSLEVIFKDKTMTWRCGGSNPCTSRLYYKLFESDNIKFSNSRYGHDNLRNFFGFLAV